MWPFDYFKNLGKKTYVAVAYASSGDEAFAEAQEKLPHPLSDKEMYNSYTKKVVGMCSAYSGKVDEFEAKITFTLSKMGWFSGQCQQLPSPPTILEV